MEITVTYRGRALTARYFLDSDWDIVTRRLQTRIVLQDLTDDYTGSSLIYNEEATRVAEAQIWEAEK